MKLAEDYENKKIPEIEFMASLATLSGKSLDELEKILDDAVNGQSQLSDIPDLRNDFDEKFAVFGGTLYRKGNVVQMWWSDTDKETWTAPNEQQAKDNFAAMKERWSEDEQKKD